MCIRDRDITTLKAVVFELKQHIVPSRFESAQQIDSHTVQLAFRTLENLTWLEISWLPESPRILQIPSPKRSVSYTHLRAHETVLSRGLGDVYKRQSPKRYGEKSTLAKQLKHLLASLALVEIKQTGFERIISFQFSSRPLKEI